VTVKVVVKPKKDITITKHEADVISDELLKAYDVVNQMVEERWGVDVRLEAV
jgi:hypothetical protein